ncbi:MAG: tyrosine-type recombinase/integrase [Phycisphaerales bacterium]|nr:tyrosine-type recombinase/integrase [Phycisphaerales bacterium]
MQNTVLNFRKDVLENLPITNKRYEISDAKVQFLKLSVGTGGTKTYYLYRKVKGKPQRIKIGNYKDLTIEQAREQAKKLNSIITLGGDPQEEKRKERNQLTFKELYEFYYNQHAKVFTKRPKDNRNMMNKHVFPVIGNIKAEQITKEKLRKLHLSIGEIRSGATANRIITVVSSVFTFCIKHDYFAGTNPCSRIKKFRTFSRDRFLSKEELLSFFNAIEQEEELFKHFFQVLLFTGARKGNVLSMKWIDIDFELNRWRIPDTQTKNKEVNIVMLSNEVLEILKYRNEANKKLQPPSLFVFQGDGKEGYLKDPKRAFERIRKRMGKDDIRMHDLRRTLGSYMAISGVSLPIIGKALNHKSQISTAIYARLSQDPVMDAVNLAIKNMQK